MPTRSFEQTRSHRSNFISMQQTMKSFTVVGVGRCDTSNWRTVHAIMEFGNRKRFSFCHDSFCYGVVMTGWHRTKAVTSLILWLQFGRCTSPRPAREIGNRIENRPIWPEITVQKMWQTFIVGRLLEGWRLATNLSILITFLNFLD